MYIKVSMLRRSRLVIFFTSRQSSVFLMRWQVACKIFFVQSIPKTLSKNYISGYIWHKSFIWTVKCSFFNQINCVSKFLWRAAYVKLFFTSRILFSMCQQVTCEMFISKAFRRPWRKAWFHMHLRMFTSMNETLVKVSCAKRASVHKFE